MKKHILISMWLVSVFSISFITAIVEGDGLPGSGTAGDPYLIYTKDHLLNPLFEGQYEAMHVKLMDDIDFQGEHCPMLFWRWGFRGVFDGNNKKIKNIYMENQLGFIRLTIGNQTVVKNLTLVNPTLLIDEHLDPDDLQWGGLLIGYNSAGGIDCGAVIDNCHVINGDIQASVDFDPDNNIWGVTVGGLTAQNHGTIRNSSFSGTVIGTFAGGLAANNREGGTIEDCHASVDIHGGVKTGGLVASNEGVIRRCSTDGIVSSEQPDFSKFTDTGGLAGENEGWHEGEGIITDSHSNCDVLTTAKAAGGVVGSSWGGIISNCYATGSVTGYSYLGGFVGTVQTNDWFPSMGIIEKCYSTGNVSGDNRIGGFAGENGSAIIRNCYSTGSATGASVTGGLVGCIYFYPYGGYGTAIIDKCYSTGKVTGGNQTGGMVGRHWNGQQIVTNSFWNTQTSGWTYSAGGTGKTTAEMKTQSTFTSAEWNFGDVWYMGEYPVFQWELSPVQPQIDAATDGDVIVVQPGVYEGKLYFRDKDIMLTSIDPGDPNVVAGTVLQGKGVGPVVTFDGTETGSCDLAGFTITGGYNTAGGGGVRGNGTHANIASCVITGNTTELSGGGFWVFNGNISNCKIIGNSAGGVGGASVDCGGRIENCVISDNTATTCGGINNSDGEIINCTIVNNSGGGIRTCDGTITNCIIWGNSEPEISSSVEPAYSCFVGGSGNGNIDADPLFVDEAGDDYQLLFGSLCIDAGDNTAVTADTDLDGNERISNIVVDMGAYEYQALNTAPVADAGDDQSVYADVSGQANIVLDGSGSTDADGDNLNYSWTWTINGQPYSANGLNPTVTLPIGEHVIELIVDDGLEQSLPDYVTVTVLDDIPPAVEIIVPEQDAAVQDGVTLTAEATDVSGVAAVYFYLREPGGTNGIPIGYEDLGGSLNASGRWEYVFDTTGLDDGYYVILAMAVDSYGNEGWSQLIAFSIRNWAVCELLPSSENNRAGRTMPVKFSLRIVESVDPAMPFVYNEELEIRIYDSANPAEILQRSLYGDSSKDYRVNGDSELYITNFKTKKEEAVYEVEIWRTSTDFEIGSFTFSTMILGNGDLTGDGQIDVDDLAALTQNWLGNDTIADIAPYPDGDGVIDLRDFSLFAEYWLGVP